LIHIGHSEGTMQGFAAYQNATTVRESRDERASSIVAWPLIRDS